jgi:hypothetical protein
MDGHGEPTLLVGGMAQGPQHEWDEPGQLGQLGLLSKESAGEGGAQLGTAGVDVCAGQHVQGPDVPYGSGRGQAVAGMGVLKGCCPLAFGGARYRGGSVVLDPLLIHSSAHLHVPEVPFLMSNVSHMRHKRNRTD